MEVNATSFPHDLLDMLVAISEADFVSFDLELSGIPSRIQQGRPRNSGRQTLEERYIEAKQGADKHQILQVGFTCARFDYMDNRYVLRPYNVNISPLIEERLDIEREFSFQSGAIAFLLRNGFQLDAPFRSGVQYLSRDEAEQAKRRAYDRIDNKNVFEDLQLKETDHESLDFLERVRTGIAKWRAGHDASSLIITTHTGLDEQPDEPAITRFEKRLVYQLLRAEYKDLRVIGRADCMRIIPFDANREEENQKRMKARVKEQIARQTGFRWIVEALARGRVEGLEWNYFARSRSGLQIAADFDNIRNKLNRATMGLKCRQPVLVGHNMFTDLVYFYRTFIGGLPETLKEFCNILHELFPRIVDTKYLATHDGGDLNASPTLQLIDESLSAQKLPEISTHKVHDKYENVEAFHEAGYDSLLTAKIMLRLATKLDHQEQQDRSNSVKPAPSPLSEHPSPSTSANGDACETSPENGSSTSTIGLTSQSKGLSSFANGIGSIVSSPSLSPSSRNLVQVLAWEKKQKKHKKSYHTEKPIESITKELERVGFGSERNHPETHNRFGNLRDQMDSDSQQSQSSWENMSSETSTSTLYPIDAIKREPMEMLPSFESDFWAKFGNRLRIFGTQETVLHIAEWEQPAERSRQSRSPVQW